MQGLNTYLISLIWDKKILPIELIETHIYFITLLKN